MIRQKDPSIGAFLTNMFEKGIPRVRVRFVESSVHPDVRDGDAFQYEREKNAKGIGRTQYTFRGGNGEFLALFFRNGHSFCHSNNKKAS